MMKHAGLTGWILFPLLLILSCATDKLPSVSVIEEFSAPPQKMGEYLNGEPIILLHGLNGFGRDQFSDYYYWGGFLDLEARLREAGYDVRTAAVGPVSSNWDRSCEFYAFLKGGTTDYGEHHGRVSGHDRYGPTFEGLYPEWGEKDEEGDTRKVHIIAHSMGGTTARMVAQLLKEGSEGERRSSGPGTSPLFTGGHDWIKSIMTISTPHDGSSLTYEFTSYRQRELIAQLGLGFLVYWDNSFPLNNDLKLDQWEWTRRREDENEEEYRARVTHKLYDWKWTNKDFADYDLSPEGAWEMNGWVRASPDIYYFSWTTRITERKLSGRIAYHPSISLPLAPLCLNICSYQRYRSSLIDIDDKWIHNDGAVNCISQSGPKLNSRDNIIPWTGVPVKGAWNNLGELFPMDHMQIIGMDGIMLSNEEETLEKWYLQQAAFLTSLP